jgi:hypothetical protein
MFLEIVTLIIGILICGIFFMFICSLFLDNLVDSVINLKRNGLLGGEDNNTQERKETKEMNTNMNKIRQNLKKRINHKNPWDKHVTILGEVETGYKILRWEYDNNTVEARSKDVNLLYALRDCIEMYLEETEEVKE